LNDTNNLSEELIGTFPRTRDQLLNILHYVQHKHGYISKVSMQDIGKHIKMPASEIYGTVTSYTEFKIKNPADKQLKICTGISCINQGNQALIDTIKSNHSINTNLFENGPINKVAIEEIDCGFICGVGPMIQINQTMHGRIEINGLKNLLPELFENER